MRHNIGINGGSSICEIGPQPDVVVFFKCLDIYVVQTHLDTDYSLLTDRLYRRYLRLEELDKATTLMGQARQKFAKILSTSVDWESMGITLTKSSLNLTKKTLADVFSKYFECFDSCVSDARLFYNDWGKYLPVRVMVSDVPEFITDKLRPLEEYDALEGEPFWLQ
jgi:hypothetical protein